MSTRGPVLPKHYGPALGEVRQIVIHSVESGVTGGVGWSLMNGWWQNPSNQSSVHGIADPADFVYSVPDTQRAWHCGNGNSTSVGYEHAGRAAFSAQDWITPDAVKMLNNSAREIAKVGARHGIPRRWLSIAQLAANEKGYCTHNDMRIARGGTTHTDPGPNFPYKLYMQLIDQWTAGAVVNPGGNPNPQPTGPQIGGAESEDDMAYVFFTYPEVTARADGSRGTRVFLSDGVFFRHILDMEQLAHEVWRLMMMGAHPKYVTDGNFLLADVPSGTPQDAANAIAQAKWAGDPHAYGRDFEELLPK